MAEYFFLRFHHKGQFTKTKLLGATCTNIPTAMEADTFSFSVIMEHVLEDCKYTEIGGLYVKKSGGGWRLISNDAEANELLKGLTDGAYLDLYIDTTIDQAIEPSKQMQPHVITRPRTSFFEGKMQPHVLLSLTNVFEFRHVICFYLFIFVGLELQEKRKFVTIQDLQQQQKEKRKLSSSEIELVVEGSGQRPEPAPAAQVEKDEEQPATKKIKQKVEKEKDKSKGASPKKVEKDNTKSKNASPSKVT